MKIKAILTMLIMLGGACMYALPDTADAARLGGGRSFGSRPSMSQPAQAPSAMQRQSTQQRQQAAQAQQPQRKGFLGGMGGLLGGLLAGSLIGSLLFGGGFNGDASDIAISKDSQVEAKGGAANGISDWGASIGCGGNYNGTPGEEVSPDTSGLYTTGKVERIRGDETVLETIIGKVDPSAKSASSKEEADKREPLYRVLNLDGSSLKHQAQKADGVLALTAKADGAILTGTLRALGYLQNQGIEKITFTDGTHSAELVLSELIAKGQPEDVYVLTLGAENTLTLNGEAIDF